ncbi:uncharacterized protein LAJ45_08887 [Morchella importuna]|uniref:uncharacterized protein n=1 Tax=Morchella importuna TaxID=1174673 RepID=UPI001E8E651C|nr:uncharacterized protein LAJ45_08887 [Morchella importuna]KAH8147088.1 hypothetical protein LAJ45_08887 [Morchella importuna]
MLGWMEPEVFSGYTHTVVAQSVIVRAVWSWQRYNINASLSLPLFPPQTSRHGDLSDDTKRAHYRRRSLPGAEPTHMGDHEQRSESIPIVAMSIRLARARSPLPTPPPSPRFLTGPTETDTADVAVTSGFQSDAERFSLSGFLSVASRVWGLVCAVCVWCGCGPSDAQNFAW